MSSRTNRWAWVLALLAVFALVAASCGDDDDSGESSDDTGGEDGGGGESAAVPECLDIPAIYALVGPESTGFENWTDAVDLANEVGSNYADEFPDAPLTITGPGEESGTYDTFVELTIEELAEERGQDPATRPDYESSPNDNVIIEGIAGTPDSFGWVGYAFYQENADTVEAFAIEGEDGECVEPTDETIAAGTYPLSRPLFIYVNAAKAAENPAVACYVDYYLGDEGFSAVSEAGYVQLEQATWEETGSTWESEGTAGGECTDVSGDVTISGSSTVEPISSLVAEQFSATNSGVGISVDGPGTGDGFELFCNGETDISDASRPIDEEEVAACEEAGVEYVELQIGIDGLSVLHSPNPGE